jgi:hypothetical protein
MSANASRRGVLAHRGSETRKAELSGRPLEWRRNDLEAAQIEANEIPPGPGIPATGESWRDRQAITSEIRPAFGRSVIQAEARQLFFF